MKNNTKLVVINVLDSASYQDCHIKGSISVPLDELSLYAQNLDRSTHIVVYCANYICSAGRSAWHKLSEMGFENIWAYEGGIAEWYQGGFITEGSCSLDYVKEPVQRPKEEIEEVLTISAEKLKEKMKQHGLL